APDLQGGDDQDVVPLGVAHVERVLDVEVRGVVEVRVTVTAREEEDGQPLVVPHRSLLSKTRAMRLAREAGASASSSRSTCSASVPGTWARRSRSWCS